MDHDDKENRLIESKLINVALLLKLSEYDTFYDLIEQILDGVRVLSPVDEENIKRACSDIKTKIHSYLSQETIKNEEAVIDILENIVKELGYENPSLRDKINDLYVLIWVFNQLPDQF